MGHYLRRNGPKLLLLVVATLLTTKPAVVHSAVKKASCRTAASLRQNTKSVRSVKTNSRQAAARNKADLLNELLRPNTSLLSELERNE
jgi:hypothetical protein